MPTFKPKTVKKIRISKKNATTLDGTHTEFIHDFTKDKYNTIPKLKNKKKELQEMLENNDGEKLSIEQIMDIKDNISEITETIKTLRNKKKNYFLDNSKYIFEYFENKKNISNGDTAEQMTKNKILNSFFKIKSANEVVDETKNQSIVQKYLSNVDDTFLDMNIFIKPTDVCSYCHKGELIPLDDEGVLICNVCFKNVQYLIENEKPSYKEPPKEVCFYAYKKINHFKEILAQFQGKETTQITDEVIENIKQQIRKERIDISQLTYYKAKEIFKKLGYNKYYEHIAFIKNKLGIKPPIMSQELEETLCNLFMELQSPYSKNCPDYRVNFLNYYYALYKLCELLNETQFLKDIPMLKDREKIIEQDEIWKKMCSELDWEFIPTV
jgi:hypothetical protein